MPQRGSLCGLAVLVDDGRAMSVKPRFVAELAENSCAAEPSSYAYIVSLSPTHTHIHTHTYTRSMFMYKMTVGKGVVYAYEAYEAK